MKRNPRLPKGESLARVWRNCLKRIQVNDSKCWVYTGVRNLGGYGYCYTPLGNKMVHVLSYAVHCGEPPSHLVIAHQCHNPACCNPVHLQPMTQRENVRQSIERGTFHYNTVAKRKVPAECHAQIRALYRQTGWSRQRLANKYGVSVSLIEKILYSKELVH